MKNNNPESESKNSHQKDSKKNYDGSILSSLLLLIWYLFLAAFAVTALGLIALFVVCMI